LTYLKFDDIFSRLDTIHERERLTEGRTDTGRKQRLRLRTVQRRAVTAVLVLTASFQQNMDKLVKRMSSYPGPCCSKR